MFDKEFLFGVATSAYQIEGTHHKFETIWCDEKQHIDDLSDGEIACDFYHKYKDDIKYILDLGVDVYRMSISWARIEPKENEFSDEGINFYKNIFKILKDNQIKIDVTLYHWDMPKWILDEFDGFADKKIIPHFLKYAKHIFSIFDQDVNQWVTINEPWCVSTVAYYYGTHAPFRKDLTKMVKAQYYTLMAHQEVYDYYKKNYKKPIGIVLNLWMQYPIDQNKDTLIATQYSSMFHNDVFLYPMFKGTYKTAWLNKLLELGVNLDFIETRELKSLMNKTDFLGINYYQHHTISYNKKNPFLFEHNLTGYDLTDMNWEINPNGLKDMIMLLRKEFTNKPIYITENGAAFDDILEDNEIHDVKRINYIKGHLDVIESIHKKMNVKGYYLWSLFDNYEWSFGYTKRFGIIYTDYNNLVKIPKDSYAYYKKRIKT
ncbi:MAG: family 1 glycosylhydrolase [Acholeplasmataceae bacterium]|nr:family 1 glycosylhydrolase [Acholeplasmataceae bacterium]